MTQRESIVVDKENDAFVRPFSYRHYEKGTYEGRFYRVRTIALDAFRRNWKRSTWAKVILGFLIFVFVMLNLFVVFMGTALRQIPAEIGGAFDIDTFFEDMYLMLIVRTYTSTEVGIEGGVTGEMFQISGVSIMLYALVAIVGSGMVSDDLKNNTLDLYFSRISKVDYIAGKFIAIFLFCSLLFVVPAFAEYIALSIGLSLNLLDNLDVLARGVLFSLFVSFFYSSVSIGLSSATEKRTYASLAMFGLFFGSAVVSGLLLGTMGDPIYLVLNVVSGALGMMIGVIGPSSEWAYGPEIQQWHPVLFLVILIGLSWSLVYLLVQRYR